MNSKKVIPVTKTEFELEDRTIYPHAVELVDFVRCATMKLLFGCSINSIRIGEVL